MKTTKVRRWNTRFPSLFLCSAIVLMASSFLGLSNGYAEPPSSTMNGQRLDSARLAYGNDDKLQSDEKSQNPAEHTEQGGGAHVQHITIIWLKERGNAENRRQLIAGLQQLAKIPGVKSVSIGSIIPPERNPADHTKVDFDFDLAVVMTLESEWAYAKYIKDPIHSLSKKNMVGSLIDHYKMYDVDVIE